MDNDSRKQTANSSDFEEEIAAVGDIRSFVWETHSLGRPDIQNER
jgi:hypothetical protein